MIVCVNRKVIVIGGENGRTAILGSENESMIGGQPSHLALLVEENNKAEHCLRTYAISARQAMVFYCTLHATYNSVVLFACFNIHLQATSQYGTEP